MKCFTVLLAFWMLCPVGCSTEHIEEPPEHPPIEDIAGDSQTSTAELEFLSDISEFHQLHLDITEDELMSMIASNDLLVTVSERDGDKSYHVYRRDGENVIVMFREGECSGVQRMQRDVSGVPTAE